MSFTEQDRRDLFTSLEDALGSSKANHLMELLPNTPASQLVTRDDMHANTLALRGEMAELRGELKGEMAELRGEMAELRADMISRFATAKTETNRLIVAGMAANAIAVITALAS